MWDLAEPLLVWSPVVLAIALWLTKGFSIGTVAVPIGLFLLTWRAAEVPLVKVHKIDHDFELCACSNPPAPVS